MTKEIQFEGRGPTLEAALSAAHSRILPRQGQDYAISKVVDWGMQRGGFTQETLYYVVVVEANGPMKSDEPPSN